LTPYGTSVVVLHGIQVSYLFHCLALLIDSLRYQCGGTTLSEAQQHPSYHQFVERVNKKWVLPCPYHLAQCRSCNSTHSQIVLVLFRVSLPHSCFHPPLISTHLGYCTLLRSSKMPSMNNQCFIIYFSSAIIGALNFQLQLLQHQ
jgi:hypothetical protein